MYYQFYGYLNNRQAKYAFCEGMNTDVGLPFFYAGLLIILSNMLFIYYGASMYTVQFSKSFKFRVCEYFWFGGGGGVLYFGNYVVYAVFGRENERGWGGAGLNYGNLSSFFIFYSGYFKSGKLYSFCFGSAI